MLAAKNVKAWKTTIVGILLCAGAITYIVLMDETSSVVFFGSLGIGLSLMFLPDTFISGLKSLIKKNQEKEL